MIRGVKYSVQMPLRSTPFIKGGAGGIAVNLSHFDTRKKCPRPDPVNVLLSLGDTMLFNEASSPLNGVEILKRRGFLTEVRD